MSSLSVFMFGTPYIISPPTRSERSYTACVGTQEAQTPHGERLADPSERLTLVGCMHLPATAGRRTSDAVARLVELVCSGHPSRAAANHGHALAGAHSRRAGADPALGKAL